MDKNSHRSNNYNPEKSVELINEYSNTLNLLEKFKANWEFFSIIILEVLSIILYKVIPNSLTIFLMLGLVCLLIIYSVFKFFKS